MGISLAILAGVVAAGLTAQGVTSAIGRRDAKKERKQQKLSLVSKDLDENTSLAGRSGTIKTAGALSQIGQPTAGSSLGTSSSLGG
jgi:hypothetical protein